MADGTGRIVVGVDGSPAAAQALRWALRQAEATGAALEAVHAWQVPALYGSGAIVLPGEQFADSATETLNRQVDSALAGSGAAVERVVAEGHPARVLLDRAEGADLLVVGSRGHGGFVGAIIGSVSQHCVNHAKCPVVVVRAED